MIDPTPAPPEPAHRSGLSRRLLTTIVAIVIAVIVVIGIIGYAVTGLAYAQTRVGNADKTLGTVISHQNNIDSSFSDLSAKFKSLSSSGTFDPLQERDLFQQFVANETASAATYDRDDASLASARASLGEQQWLTFLARANLDHEATRIDHARKALAIAKTAATGYVQVGRFFAALYDSELDFQAFSTQIATADFGAANTTLGTMKTHVDKGLQLSTAPSLPAELHTLMGDFETLVSDFSKLLAAAAANDDTAVVNAENSVQADASKLTTYKIDDIMAKIAAYYRPLYDQVSSELARAA
ncbi:MAG TPA: hypothetical protein VKF16_02305 [Candidatus Dormibacteraeota bacterium]|nr:hypothetical protein [Candidatus Dormibacteraeota bacterium]